MTVLQNGIITISESNNDGSECQVTPKNIDPPAKKKEKVSFLLMRAYIKMRK